MSTLELLKQDYTVLTEILHARRAVSAETMQESERIAWQMYLAILADALNTLDALIDHLTPRDNGRKQVSP
jgi:hypothetical protein